MAGISKCTNTQCLLRKDCLRYRIYPVALFQSYSEYKPNNKGNCDNFLEIKLKTNLKPFYEN